MLGASVFVVTLVAAMPTATAVAAPDMAAIAVREDRRFAIWVEPQLTAFSLGSGRADLLGSDVGVLPLGIELGGQIGRVFLSVALARLPVANVERDEVMLAGRFYLGERTWAPYLAAAVGWMTAEIDDSGGESESHRFAAAGVGEELALRNGFSLTGDLLLGPDFVKGRFSSSYDNVNLSGWLRLGIGYRF
ncbi:MAG TPA: hypothetical protein VI456_01515 [Polyangia bacterium]